MHLIVGLGNPGDKYAKNRHNIGFLAVEEIAKKHGFPPFREKFKGLIAEGIIAGEKVLILKPQTFMNSSGDSVEATAQFYKLSPADITVVCVDVPGCEHGAILSTAEGGTVIFFSMATSFSAAALGAEGLAADVTMLVGNGYTPGHAQLALDLLRTEPGVRALFEDRLARESA